jgi:hypothetical protein
LRNCDLRGTVRYVTDVESGYLSVVCRARDDIIPSREDNWMLKSTQSATIEKNLLRDDTGRVDLLRALSRRAIHGVERSSDAHVLRLADVS